LEEQIYIYLSRGDFLDIFFNILREGAGGGGGGRVVLKTWKPSLHVVVRYGYFLDPVV